MAIGSQTFSNLGGATSDLFSGFGAQYRAKGAAFEKASYLSAAGFADKEVDYTKMSTAIKQSQADRTLYKSLGETENQVASAGFAESGSGLDILRESAQQGAMERAVLGQQGLITEEGFHQEAESYRNMTSAADVAIKADKLAAKGAFLSAGLKGVASIATLV